MTLRRLFVLASIVLIGGLVVWYLVLPRFRPHVFAGSVIQSDEKAPELQLQTSGGRTVRLEDYAGKVVVMYFGYTFCPDACPTTLAKLARARQMLDDKADDVQVIMISVDPERDTPEMVAEYVGHFDPSFVGLTGDPAVVNRVATLYGVYYEKEAGSAATGYLVNHTATVMVIDREGYLKLVLPFEGTAQQFAADIDYFL